MSEAVGGGTCADHPVTSTVGDPRTLGFSKVEQGLASAYVATRTDGVVFILHREGELWRMQSFGARKPSGLDWPALASAVLTLAPGQDLLIKKADIVHPKTVGFRPSIGLVFGQLADWRLALEDGRGLHVREYLDHYVLHYDATDPSVSFMRHLAEDTPALFKTVLAVGLLGAGTAIGAATGDTERGAAIGGIAGLLGAMMFGGK